MILAEIPETTSVFWKNGRNATYSDWPFKDSDKCNAECMAAAGFYVVRNSNKPDLVECFMCGKQFDNWKPDDNPWSHYIILFNEDLELKIYRKKHMKCKLICPFVTLNKRDEDWSLRDLVYLCKEYTHIARKDKVREALNKVNRERLAQKECKILIKHEKYRKRYYVID